MKNGFTLVELLAVIVILAVIALIATPIVLSIINDTKESAVIRSAEMYVGAVENKIMQENMKLGGKLNPKECIVNSDGNVTCDGTYLEIEVNGDKPDSGFITYDRGRVTGITLTFGERKVVTNSNGELVLEDQDKLVPGLYDENDNLLISWKDLTSDEYQSLTYINEDGEEVTTGILSVNKEGVLSSAYDSESDEFLSVEYLVGKLVIDDSVIYIDDYAFYDCSGLTSVILGNSVTSIGNSAFYGCSSLTSVTIPNSVTSIGEYAFYDCSSLTSVTIGNGVTSIGEDAFNYSDLESIVVEEGNTIYDSRNNSNAIIETETNILIRGSKNTVIPNTVTSIGDEAFATSGLENITIPDSVTSIGKGAFNGCTDLVSVTIPNSVTSIGEDAFSGCSSLMSVTIPNSVTEIGGWAFSGCSSLTSVTIPNSVTEIGAMAFNSCTDLVSVTIPDSVTSIGSMAFQGCSSLTSVTIPNSVTSIGVYAFYGCSSLTSVTIPNSVTEIGEAAFRSSKLSTIYYKGTEAEWNAIKKGVNWDWDTSSDKVINYNYTG